MRYITRILAFLSVIILFSCISDESAAYMTLFNDTGDWILGVLGNPDEGNEVYRACKNSRDRNSDPKGNGSLAIICLSVSQHGLKPSLGIWHSVYLGKPGEKLPFRIEAKDMQPITGESVLKATPFGKSNAILLDDENSIKNIFRQKEIKIFFGKSADDKTNDSTVVFDNDLEGMQKAAQPVYNYLSK